VTISLNHLPPLPSLRGTRVFAMAVEHLQVHRPDSDGRCACGRAGCRIGVNAWNVIQAANVDPRSYLQPAASTQMATRDAGECSRPPAASLGTTPPTARTDGAVLSATAPTAPAPGGAEARRQAASALPGTALNASRRHTTTDWLDSQRPAR